MTPIDATPTSVLFDLAKRHCGVSHKELAGLLLSGRPLSDGRSPQSRLGDRTWVSRFIVHAPAGTLSDSYFCDYAVGALRFAARMKSRSKRALTGEAILDIVCGEAGRAMDDALKACSQSPTLYRNMMERIACEGSLTADERAEVALVLLVTAACTADVRRAVAEARTFSEKMHGGGLATPPLVPMPQGAGRTAVPTGADDRPRWLGLLRIVAGVVAGAPQWVEPTATGAEVERQQPRAVRKSALTSELPRASGSDVDSGAWWVEADASAHGTVSSEWPVARLPRRPARDGCPPACGPGDQLCLAASTNLSSLIEGYPATSARFTRYIRMLTLPSFDIAISQVSGVS